MKIWQIVQDTLNAIFPVSFAGLSDIEKINAIAAFSQTIAAFLSLTALLVSLWVFTRQQKLNRWQLRLHREDHIIQWSRDCIGVLAEIEEAAKAHDGDTAMLLPEQAYISFRSRLSALIDEGRLYFPNIKSLTHGKQNHGAYRGHRPEILDPLVEFYDQMKAVQEAPETLADDAAITALNAIRRAFVSAAQTAIDPRTFNRIRA